MDIILAWVAAISSGVEPLILKATSKNLVKSPWLFNILWTGFSLVLIIPFSLMIGAGMPTDITPLLLSGASCALFFLLYTYTLYKIDASTMSPLFAIRTVFALMLGVFILGEDLSPLKILLVIVLLCASPLASFNETTRFKAFKSRNILLAIAAMGVLALDGFFTNIAYAANGAATTILWRDTFSFIFLLPSLFLVRWKNESWNISTFVPFASLAVLAFIYTVSTTVAYGRAYVLSSVIVSLPLSMIFVYFAAKKWPDMLEQHTNRVYAVRFTGAAIMVTCAILLSVIN